MERLSRRVFLGRALGVLLLGLGASGAAKVQPAHAGSARLARPLRRLSVRTSAGLRRRPGALRDHQPAQRRRPKPAAFSLELDRTLDVVFEVASRHGAGQTVHCRTPLQLPRGPSEIPWTPKPSTRPGSYLLRVREAGEGSAGPAARPGGGARARRRGDLRQRSALAGQTADLTIQATQMAARDAAALRARGRADPLELADEGRPGRSAAAGRPARCAGQADRRLRAAPRRAHERAVLRPPRRPVRAISASRRSSSGRPRRRSASPSSSR